MPKLYQYDILADPISPVFAETVSLDRTHPNIEVPNPQWNKDRKVVGTVVVLAALTCCAFVQVVPAAERTSPDKYAPEIQRPVFDLKRAQYDSPVSIIPDRQQLPDTDTWLPESQRPVFYARRIQALYPKLDLTAIVSTATPVGVDSWHPEISRPSFETKKTQYLYYHVKSVLVPLVNGAAGGLPAQTFIYTRGGASTSNVGPITNIFKERTSADKWHPEIQRPTFYPKRLQYLYPYFSSNFTPLPYGATSGLPAQIFIYTRGSASGISVLPLFAISAPTVNLDTWWQQSFNPSARPARSWLYPSLSFAEKQFTESIFPDKWQPNTEKPRFDSVRRQDRYPSLTFSEFQFTETTRADRWHPEISRPRFDLVRMQYESQFFVVPDQQQTPDSDSWSPEQQKPLFDLKRIQSTYPSLTFQPQVGEVVYADKWHPEILRPRFDPIRRQDTYPTATFSEFQFTEIVYLDKWVPRLDEKIFDVGRLQSIYPNASFEPQPRPSPIFAGQWWQQPNTPVFLPARSQWTYPIVGVSPISSVFTERTTPDKWLGLPNVPTFDLRRLQGRYPFLAFAQTIFAETVSADRWHPEISRPKFDLVRMQYEGLFYTTPEKQSVPRSDSWSPDNQRPLFDLRRMQATYPSLAFSEFQFSESIYLDKWIPRVDDKIFDRVRLQALYPSLNLDVFPRPNTSFLDQWWQQPNSPVFLPKRAQWDYPSTGFGPISNVFTERTTPDKWYQETSRPRFDFVRQQFTSLFFNEPDRQPTPTVGSILVEPQRPLFDLKRIQWTYPSLAFSEFQFAETTRPDKWHPEISRPNFDRLRLQYGAQFFVTPDRQQTPDADSWLPEQQRPIFTLKNLQYTYQVFADSLVRVEAIYSDKWHPTIVQPLFDAKRTQSVYPASNIAPVSTTYSEKVTPDRWAQPQGSPIFIRRQVQQLLDNPVTVARQVSVDAWFQLNTVVFKQTASVKTEAVTTFSFELTTTINLWTVPSPIPQRSSRVVAGYTTDPIPQGVAAPSTFPQVGTKPLFDLARKQFTYPYCQTGPVATTFTETVLADKWHPEMVNPIFDVARLQWTYPSFFSEVLRIIVPTGTPRRFNAILGAIQILQILDAHYRTYATLNVASSLGVVEASPRKFDTVVRPPGFEFEP